MTTPVTKKVSPSETVEARTEYAPEANTALGNLSNAAVDMKKVDGYDTFLAEYATREGAFIIHFFLPLEGYVRKAGRDGPEPREEYLRYWQNKFPMVLSSTATAYFEATYPRIFAEWVPEMRSWYMKCNGFANRLDPVTFIENFFEALDEALDKAGVP